MNKCRNDHRGEVRHRRNTRNNYILDRKQAVKHNGVGGSGDEIIQMVDKLRSWSNGAGNKMSADVRKRMKARERLLASRGEGGIEMMAEGGVKFEEGATKE